MAAHLMLAAGGASCKYILKDMNPAYYMPLRYNTGRCGVIKTKIKWEGSPPGSISSSLYREMAASFLPLSLSLSIFIYSNL